MCKKWLLSILFLITSICVHGHEQDLLKNGDISRIMQQILSEHVQKKEVTEQILHKAFEVYITQFDPYRMYLLESEVAPYFNPSPAQLEKAIEEYKQNNFDQFKQLNLIIQGAIERSRKIRGDIGENLKQTLFHSNSDKEQADEARQEGAKGFVSTKEQLKGRILQNLGMYVELQKKRYGEAMTPQRKEQIVRSYESRLREVENQYLYQNEKGQPLPPVEEENLFALHVLKALASSLDSHTSFYASNEAYDMRVRLQKEFKGIGLVLKDTNQGVVVTHVLEGGPAAKSKLIQNGDILIEIDGKPTSDLSFEKTMELLHGENSKIKLVFKRKGESGKSDQIYSAELSREVIILNNDRVDVSSEAFGNGVIGIVALHSFYQGDGISSVQDVRNAIEKLQKEGTLKGLILDLRDNGGGFLSQAVKVAGLFITDGVIVISKYSNGEEKVYRDVDGQAIYEGPLVVLTTKATASAAEIVAQALQDYGVALIVGDEHTYGKGTIQTQTVTDNESTSYFKVTVGRYYTVSGHTPQKEGVKADIIAPSHWHNEEIGEMYADSLGNDVIPPLYNDSLKDVPADLRSWYIKYYIPKLQKKVSLWRDLLPVLRKNSEYRIAHNKNYQFFLKGHVPDEENDSDGEDEWIETKNKTYGQDDLQVQEGVNIIKDMVLLNNLTKK